MGSVAESQAPYITGQCQGSELGLDLMSGVPPPTMLHVSAPSDLDQIRGPPIVNMGVLAGSLKMFLKYSIVPGMGRI